MSASEMILHGPAHGEGPARRYGPVARVAVLSDVHANVPALDAVLAELTSIGPDLVVFNGDLTWGADPRRALDRVDAALGDRALFVRGNSERAVVEMACSGRPSETDRERWMVAQHAGLVDRLAGFAFSLIIDVDGLGPVRFCHGSPRSDHELVTHVTPEGRFAELSAAIDERILVTGHTHLQFDRMVAGRRSVNPGSVGLPYHQGRPGVAYWALLGPDVELRQTRYDVDAMIARGAEVGDPAADRIAKLLRQPLTPSDIAADEATRAFAD